MHRKTEEEAQVQGTKGVIFKKYTGKEEREGIKPTLRRQLPTAAVLF